MWDITRHENLLVKFADKILTKKNCENVRDFLPEDC